MKVLIITSSYFRANNSDGLVSELANYYFHRGHSVTVLCVDWKYRFFQDIQDVSDIGNTLDVYFFKPFCSTFPYFGLIFKWLFSSLKLVPFLFKSILWRRKYDLFLSFSPCTSMLFFLPFARIISYRMFLIYWDFFPIHNFQIFNQFEYLRPILKAQERFLVSLFHSVGLMDSSSLAYFKTYFSQSTSQNLTILPLWTSTLDNHNNHIDISLVDAFRDPNNIFFVFGGSLSRGRSIELLIQEFISIHESDASINLVICGAGELSPLVKSYSLLYSSSIHFLGSLSRTSYLSLLNVVHVGLISTDINVSCPAYPSKSLDYMSSSLPLCISMDPVSEFPRLATSNCFGLSAPLGTQPFVDNVKRFARDPMLRYTFGQNSNNFLKRNHSLPFVYDTINACLSNV